MLKASMKPDVPSPSNRHRPLASTNEGTPPPVPPRTYSQRGQSNGGPGRHSYSHAPVSKPMRKYCLEEFQFLKLLGKGSFGKVSVCVCVCVCVCVGVCVWVCHKLRFDHEYQLY